MRLLQLTEKVRKILANYSGSLTHIRQYEELKRSRQQALLDFKKKQHKDRLTQVGILKYFAAFDPEHTVMKAVMESTEDDMNGLVQKVLFTKKSKTLLPYFTVLSKNELFSFLVDHIRTADINAIMSGRESTEKKNEKEKSTKDEHISEESKLLKEKLLLITELKDLDAAEIIINNGIDIAVDKQVMLLTLLNQIKEQTNNKKLQQAILNILSDAFLDYPWLKKIDEKEKCKFSVRLRYHESVDEKLFRNICEELTADLNRYLKSIHVSRDRRTIVSGRQRNQNSGLLQKISMLHSTENQKRPCEKFSMLYAYLRDANKQLLQDDKLYNKSCFLKHRNFFTQSRLQVILKKFTNKIEKINSPQVKAVIGRNKLSMDCAESLFPKLETNLNNYGFFHRQHRKDQAKQMRIAIHKITNPATSSHLDISATASNDRIEQTSNLLELLYTYKNILDAEDKQCSQYSWYSSKGGKLRSIIETGIRQIHYRADHNGALKKAVKTIRERQENFERTQSRNYMLLQPRV